MSLVAFSVLAGVVIVGLLIEGCVRSSVLGIKVLFGAAAVLLGVAIFVGVELLIVKWRPQLLKDPEYLRLFEGFRPDETQRTRGGKDADCPESDDLERCRIERYQQNRGLFLVHEWRPSSIPGQKVDIVIFLNQHGQGPISHGTVASVTYQLGNKFMSAPRRKTNSQDRFALRVSAYGPMLCIARVEFSNGSSPLMLERYIDFPIEDHDRT